MTPPSPHPSPYPGDDPDQVTRSIDARVRAVPHAERERVRGPRHGPQEPRTIPMPTQRRVPEVDWPSRRLTRALVVLSVVATGLYAGWWLVPGHAGNPVLFWLLAAAELFTVSHMTGLWQAVWSQRIDLPPPGSLTFTVDVFIATYGEPLPELRRTIASAVGMDGPHRTYVLDDACRDEVRALADALGARYIPRESSEGAKAGNLNHALTRTDGDLLVILDADHVVRKDFLTHVLGYFEDPDVGIVQTPQFYGNATVEPVARRAWYQQTPFYGTILRGKQGLNAVFLCGTNAIMRRSAVQEVGGFHEESVVEDMATSILLQQAGWKSVYFPFVLAEGQGPTTLRAYFSQQFRWARGSLGAFRSVFRGGFDLVQRLQYLFATTYYLVGIATAIYLALPVLGLLFGLRPFEDALTFGLFYLPHIVLSMWLIRRSLNGNFSLRNTQATAGAFPVYVAGAIAAVTSRSVDFTPTASQETRRPPWLAWVTVATAAVLLGSLIAAPLLHGWTTWSWVAGFWAVIDLYLIGPTAWTTLREAFGDDEPAGAQPDEEATLSRYSSAPTYRLGQYAAPPLPEEIFG